MRPTDAERMQIQLFRAMTPVRRADLAGQLSDIARELLLQGIRQQHPESADEQIHAEFLRRALGKALAAKVLTSKSR